MQPSLLTVNDKGSIGVAKAVADLLHKRYYAFLPFDGSSPVDLVIANKAMTLKRLQVKYREPVKRSPTSLCIPLYSVVNGKMIPIDLSKIDGWAIYCPTTDKVYYINKRLINIDSVTTFHLSLKGGKERSVDNYLCPDVFWT